MADVFYTILIVWVLWKIFGGSSVKTNTANNQPPQKKEGSVSFTYDGKKSTKQQDEGEYIDYEEVKNKGGD